MCDAMQSVWGIAQRYLIELARFFWRMDINLGFHQRCNSITGTHCKVSKRLP
jgi:hypothetical protein